MNDTDQRYGDKYAFKETGGENCCPISGVYLVDTANKKKYLLVRDAEGKCRLRRDAGDLAEVEPEPVGEVPGTPEDVKAVTGVIK